MIVRVGDHGADVQPGDGRLDAHQRHGTGVLRGRNQGHADSCILEQQRYARIVPVWTGRVGRHRHHTGVETSEAGHDKVEPRRDEHGNTVAR